MKFLAAVLILALGLATNSEGVSPNFDFNFSGFTKLTQLLSTTCTDIEGQINSKIGGIQKPSHAYEHITCAVDENMGTRIKFTIHRDEDDDTASDDPARQRLEMHTRNRDDLHAKEGDTFIYAWWFFVGSGVIANTHYWHIFQIKASGDTVDPNPALCFSLKSNLGFHVAHIIDPDVGGENIPIQTLPEMDGNWIQSYVKINYAEKGSAEIHLKDLNGKDIFHQTLSGNFWWNGAEYFGPKWGLYRKRSTDFQERDYIFFQNVQIWKK